MNQDGNSRFCRELEASFAAPQLPLRQGTRRPVRGVAGDELPRKANMLMPGYTCMVVPSADQYAGLAAIYVDIDPDTFNVNPALLDAAARPDAAALIVQHTYGIPCDMAAIGDWTSRRGIPSIEDCCHSFGTKTNGRLCGTFGKFAFMSGQWNKPFSTGLGGMLW